MDLFTTRDRIAIALLAAIIVGGWSLRLLLTPSPEETGVRVIPAAEVTVDDPAAARTSAATLVDINTADEAALAMLPLIGPVKAAAIVSYRREHGPFKDTADLVKVRGVGPATLDRLLPYITIGPGPDAR